MLDFKKIYTDAVEHGKTPDEALEHVKNLIQKEQERRKELKNKSDIQQKNFDLIDEMVSKYLSEEPEEPKEPSYLFKEVIDIYLTELLQNGFRKEEIDIQQEREDDVVVTNITAKHGDSVVKIRFVK